MDSVQVYLFEMDRIRHTDPQGFTLMIVGVSLMVFLSLTIFGGFIFYLYRGDGQVNKRKAAEKAKLKGTAPDTIQGTATDTIQDTTQNVD